MSALLVHMVGTFLGWSCNLFPHDRSIGTATHTHKTSTGEDLPPVHFHGQNQTFASSSKANLH